MGAAMKLSDTSHTVRHVSSERAVSVSAVLAQNILLAREARDWTQQQLADAAGVSRATVAQLEAGAGDPRLSTVDLLAGALGVTPAVLLFGGPEVDALADLTARGADAPIFTPGQLAALGHLIASNRPSGRLEAARVGIGAATEAGFAAAAARVGAGIASYRRPGPATAALARFAETAGGGHRGGAERGPAPAPVAPAAPRLARPGAAT